MIIWYTAGSQSSTSGKADAKLGVHKQLEASLPGTLDLDNKLIGMQEIIDLQ